MKQVLIIFILVFIFQMCTNKHKAPTIVCDNQMEFVLDSLKMIYKFENGNINSYRCDSENDTLLKTEDFIRIELFNADTINTGNYGLICYDVMKAIFPHIINNDDFSSFEVCFIYPNDPDICGTAKVIASSYTSQEMILPNKLGADFITIRLKNGAD